MLIFDMASGEWLLGEEALKEDDRKDSSDLPNGTPPFLLSKELSSD
jgi:hypothetical protein